MQCNGTILAVIQGGRTVLLLEAQPGTPTLYACACTALYGSAAVVFAGLAGLCSCCGLYCCLPADEWPAARSSRQILQSVEVLAPHAG